MISFVEQRILQYAIAKTGAGRIQGEKIGLPVALPKIRKVKQITPAKSGDISI